VVYHWETSRGPDSLKNVIATDFQGTDAYVAYRSLVKKHEGNITLAGCWAHPRRNFYEARGAPRRTSRLPAESSGTALDVRLTERTAYFASIACASHNWLSAQVTLPWFKSSDFAAAESSE
jgi:Transposase IS66 family